MNFKVTRKRALDKKLEWERIYEGLKDILDILTSMDEKPVMQSELLRLIQTAKVQAQLWANPANKNAPMRAHDVGVSDYDKDASGDKMADLKVRAAIIEKMAAKEIARVKGKTADMDDVVLPGLKRYPEFKPLVDELRVMVVRAIQAKADKIESQMPYKQQFVLEELIQQLQELV